MKRLLLLAAIALMLLIPSVSVIYAGEFTNPLDGTITIQGVLYNISRWLIGIVGLLAMLALIWGGILYIISFNNDQYLNNAKGIIKWAIIGLAIVLLSYVIIRTVAVFVGAPGV